MSSFVRLLSNYFFDLFRLLFSDPPSTCVYYFKACDYCATISDIGISRLLRFCFLPNSLPIKSELNVLMGGDGWSCDLLGWPSVVAGSSIGVSGSCVYYKFCALTICGAAGDDAFRPDILYSCFVESNWFVWFWIGAFVAAVSSIIVRRSFRFSLSSVFMLGFAFYYN